MSSIGIGSGPTHQNLTPSYSPLGKPATGLESPENKDHALPPVEESNAGDKNRYQPNQKTDAASDKKGGAGSDRQNEELNEAEQQQVRELADTDRAVRAHEAAHQAVGGSLAGAASFRFVTGPDGARYAVGGEVPITLTTINDDPQATIRNAEQVRAAALAPAQPSAQDRSVAVAAVQIIAQAQLEAALQRSAELKASDQGERGNATKSAAVDSFHSNEGRTTEPGSLFDQHS